MKNSLVFSAILGILILGTFGLTSNVYASQGKIIWINPSEKLGKIAEDGCEDESCYHPFQIPKDLTIPDYIPKVGDKVTFDLGPGNTVSNVAIAGEASISPTCGAVGDPFTITDPQRRIQSGDLVVFTPERGDPAASGVALFGVISPDGSTLTGTVPEGITITNAQFFVTVTESSELPPRFESLAFYVSSSCTVPPPTGGGF